MVFFPSSGAILMDSSRLSTVGVPVVIVFSSQGD